MILACDLNNTLMDQIQGIVNFSKGKLSLNDFSEWDMDNSGKMGMSTEEYLTWAWKNPNIEISSPAFSGASQALLKVKRQGSQIWIVTASNLSKIQIEQWLVKHTIPFDRIIKTRNKMGIGDLLIDDSPVTCQQFYNSGLPILRYALPWNNHLSYIPKINNWGLPLLLKKNCQQN